MKKMGFCFFNYLIFILISSIPFFIVYYVFRDCDKVLMILSGMAGGWLSLTIIFFPTLASFNLLENQKN